MKKLFFIILVVLTCLTTLAEVRFVSKTGSSTPPYTSWATATDSIQKCINISQGGDTIYVANGVYYEQVVMIPGLALIGSGMDSCVIDTKVLAQPSDFFAVQLADSCSFKGFTVDVSNGYDGDAINVARETRTGIIEENLLSNAWAGCYVSSASCVIRKNIIKNVERGISLKALPSIYQQEIENNIITNIRYFGITINVGAQGIVRNNFIYLDKPWHGGFIMGLSEGLGILNNTIIADTGQTGISNSLFQPITAQNNIVIGKFSYAAILTGTNNQIKNNIVMNGDAGIRLEEGHTSTIKYNNVWNNRRNYINFTPDSTNLSVDPMFVDEDSLDFHLQMSSPLIDVGDPSILDKDGSRSDNGVYGGPYGESYTYQDLAPKPPRNLTAKLDSGNVTLKWLPNTEADFYLYRVYRDTVSNFIYDTTKIIAVTSDTAFTEPLPSTQNSYYYKITAIDSQYNQSPASEEAAVLVVDAEEPKLIANDYQFYPNYPNPFNPSTTLSYRLKDNGTVRLVVYDIKGELIEELLNEYQQAGYYEVDWNAEKGKLSSGIYLFRIEVKNEKDIPVFSDLRKSILVK